MRLADLLQIALTALWQQKVRTLLTLAGVTIGTFSLAVSLSLGRGFEAEVLRQMSRRDQLRQVQVFPSSAAREEDIQPEKLLVAGEMSEAKRERLRRAVVRRETQRGGSARRTTRRLNAEQVQKLAALPHVEAVEPIVQEPFRVQFNDWSPPASLPRVLGVGVSVEDEAYRDRIVAGSYLPADDGPWVVVGEYLLYTWHITSDRDVQSVVGRKLRLQYRGSGAALVPTLADLLSAGRYGMSSAEGEVLAKAIRQLPLLEDRLALSPEERTTLTRLLERVPLTSSTAEQLARGRAEAAGAFGVGLQGPLPVLPFVLANPEFTADFTIAGVFRELGEDDENIFFAIDPLSKNADLLLPVNTARDIFLRSPANRENGFGGLVLTVDSEANVKEVARQIKALGLNAYSLGEWMERLRTNLLLSTFVTSFLAAVALLVACLGITNTMIMSVLERRREIGIMKAVGARDSHVQFIFLLEGVLLGGIGGTLGMIACWVASMVGDSTARRLLAQQNELPLKGTLFVFPAWLTVGVPLFVCLVTTLAAFYPARRAARVNPIVALRHE